MSSNSNSKTNFLWTNLASYYDRSLRNLSSFFYIILYRKSSFTNILLSLCVSVFRHSFSSCCLALFRPLFIRLSQNIILSIIMFNNCNLNFLPMPTLITTLVTNFLDQVHLLLKQAIIGIPTLNSLQPT